MKVGEGYKQAAIVCDADKLSQVAIIQELGRLSIPVVALAGSASAIGLASKYVSRRITCSIPSYKPEYISFLISQVPPGVVFYSNDANTENVSRHKERLLASGFSLLISDHATLERVIHKNRLYHTALACGVSVPRCCLVRSAAEVEAKVTEFGLPLILKSTNLAGGVYRFVRSRDEAPAVFRQMTEIVTSEAWRHRGAHLMVQQWVPQTNMKLWNFNACVTSGEIVSFSMGERIRTDTQADGSLGSVLLFGRTGLDPEILEQNRRILKHLQFDGIVETEWSKSTAETGQTYLYDFNPRPSGNIRWTFKSGVSLAEQYYRLALGLPPRRQTMKSGVLYAKVLFRQNDWLAAITDSRLSLAQKLAVVQDDLRALAQCRRHAVDVLDLSDLGPTVRATRELASSVSARLRRLAHRSSRSGRFRLHHQH